jgi:hypothetical protein
MLMAGHALITKYLVKWPCAMAAATRLCMLPTKSWKWIYTIHIGGIYPTYTWYMPF